MDQIGSTLANAVTQALGTNGCEVRVTFATQKECTEAGERLQTTKLEMLPGMGNFMFDTKHSTAEQIELLNGSCILLLVKGSPR
jgi:hypothetical protein